MGLELGLLGVMSVRGGHGLYSCVGFGVALVYGVGR